MSLREYRRKRHFDVTAEPAGERTRTAAGNLYVIQKHAATRLHYDLRLELDGVLKSWAVPKGPSLDPQKRNLAAEVEDHPVEYGSFEGIIPKGQYGGGTVMLWDRGTWEAIGDARKDYERGKLKFVLHGQKLRGIWNLVRMRPRDPKKKPEWLLIKHGDAYARPAEEYDITVAEPRSVLSGRDLEEIAAADPSVWQSRPAAQTRRRGHPKLSERPRIDPSSLPGAKPAAQPAFLAPQLATLATKVPTGDAWLHEVKLDGYRIVAVLRDGRANLYSRRRNEWTASFPNIAQAVEALPLRSAILDGEVVALNAKGVPDFQALQNAMKSGGRVPLVYYLFDLPYCDGFDLTRTPLIERRKLLQSILSSAGNQSSLRFNDHVVGNGPEVFEQASRMGLEGIVSKRADSPYIARRGSNWLKSKSKLGQEFVIGGFTDPEGTRHGFGALLVGYYDGDGKLVYAGRVGSGFTDTTLSELSARLKKLATTDSPFADAPRKRGYHWVRPELVAQVEYMQFTDDGQLRHPSFKGVREDKAPREVVLERPGKSVLPVSALPDEHVSSTVKVVSPRSSTTIAGVTLSNPERVLYPDEGLTKTDLARYYEAVADRMLPHVVGRPLMVVRCPKGVQGESFYQKHKQPGFPAAIRTIPIQEKNETREHLVLDDVRGLVSLAQMSVLEIHTWGCREVQIESPDRLVFDLDPAPDVEWARIAEAAELLRQFLLELKLQSFLKLSGGKGLHVVVPIERRNSWDEAEHFTQMIANAFATAKPDRYVATMSKAKRKGKIYIDYLRNLRGATCVAAYSTRARPGAAISMPIDWSELKNTGSGADFTLQRVLGSGMKVPDAWKELPRVRQRLPAL